MAKLLQLLYRWTGLMFSQAVLEHFQNPRNAGELAGANVRSRVENPACGDILELWLDVQDGVIRASGFRAKGCVASIACGSYISEELKGKSVAEAGQLQRANIIRGLDGLPEASGHAAQLAIDALRAALSQAKLNQRVVASGQ